MESLYQFFIELDKLKSVYRRSYLTDFSRNENSAEHSWHLLVAILTLDQELNLDIDLLKTLKIALVHDICEIGAGDVSVFAADRSQKTQKERVYIQQLTKTQLGFASDIQVLWEEYEAQETLESRWVKVVDRLLPFMMNLATNGKAWIEQSVSRSDLLAINQTTKREAPEIYAWMLIKIEEATTKGWLIDR